MKRIAEFEAIGTHWNIDVSEEENTDHVALAMRSVFSCIEEFDRTYSRFRTDSFVTAASNSAGSYHLPPNAAPMFALYRRLYDLTDGAFTPLIGRTLSDAGYDAAYSFQSKDLVTPPAWDDVMEFKDSTLTTYRPVLLDFGAAGKGYLVDLVAETLLAAGITSFLVNAGGDIRVVGETAQIALEHPTDATQAIGIATLENKSICGSAGNRRTWGKYHHTIDPRTLESPRHILATWVVANTTILADALTTCLAFVPPDVLKRAFDFEYAIVNADLTLAVSAQFPGEFFR